MIIEKCDEYYPWKLSVRPEELDNILNGLYGLSSLGKGDCPIIKEMIRLIEKYTTILPSSDRMTKNHLTFTQRQEVEEIVRRMIAADKADLLKRLQYSQKPGTVHEDDDNTKY